MTYTKVIVTMIRWSVYQVVIWKVIMWRHNFFSSSAVRVSSVNWYKYSKVLCMFLHKFIWTVPHPEHPNKFLWNFVDIYKTFPPPSFSQETFSSLTTPDWSTSWKKRQRRVDRHQSEVLFYGIHFRLLPSLTSVCGRKCDLGDEKTNTAALSCCSWSEIGPNWFAVKVNINGMKHLQEGDVKRADGFLW